MESIIATGKLEGMTAANYKLYMKIQYIYLPLLQILILNLRVTIISHCPLSKRQSHLHRSTYTIALRTRGGKCYIS